MAAKDEELLRALKMVDTAGLCYRSICCWRRRSYVVSYGVDLLLVSSDAADGWSWQRLWWCGLRLLSLTDLLLLVWTICYKGVVGVHWCKMMAGWQIWRYWWRRWTIFLFQIKQEIPSDIRLWILMNKHIDRLIVRTIKTHALIPYLMRNNDKKN